MNDCPGEATEDSNLIRKKTKCVRFDIDRNRLLFLRHNIMLLDATASL